MKIKDTIFDTSVCVLLSENRPLPPLPQPPVLQSDEKNVCNGFMSCCSILPGVIQVANIALLHSRKFKFYNMTYLSYVN